MRLAYETHLVLQSKLEDPLHHMIWKFVTAVQSTFNINFLLLMLHKMY